MRDYRWFKILLRAMGLLLLGFAMPQLTSAVGSVLFYFSNEYSRSSGFSYWPVAVSSAVGALAQLLLALYLISGAPKFIRYCIDQVDRRCIRCDYDLTGLKGTCPECGLPIPEPTQPAQTAT
jgi:hypothetical protein